MGRIIDEDDVLKILCRELCHPGAICPDGYCEEMREKLKDVPTAHPEPPKMGKWIQDESLMWVWYCSECGERTTEPIMGKPRYKFCPMCGTCLQAEE